MRPYLFVSAPLPHAAAFPPFSTPGVRTTPPPTLRRRRSP